MFVFVGLGSNQGDRAANLRAGIGELARFASPNGIWESPVYESAPMYVTDQPPFLNMVIGGSVTLDLWEVLYHFKVLEGELGRDLSIHAPRNGPRPLDMDILLAYEVGHLRLITEGAMPIMLDTPELTVPHPKMTERAFVLYPLRDLAPDVVHPMLHRTIAELAEDVQGQDARKLAYLEEIERGEPIEQMRWSDVYKKPPVRGDVIHEDDLDAYVFTILSHDYPDNDGIHFIYWFREAFGKNWTLRLLDALLAELRVPAIHIQLIRYQRANLAQTFARLRAEIAEAEYEGMLP